MQGEADNSGGELRTCWGSNKEGKDTAGGADKEGKGSVASRKVGGMAGCMFVAGVLKWSSLLVFRKAY